MQIWASLRVRTSKYKKIELDNCWVGIILTAYKTFCVPYLHYLCAFALASAQALQKTLNNNPITN